jgi:hypothetical protein
MAIDIKKMLEKKKQLDSPQGGGNGGSVFWKPEEGDSKIRILCPDDGDPFKGFYFHYRIGEKMSLLCPKKTYGDACPICEHASSLYNEGSPEAREEAKKYYAKQRFYSPILVRGRESEGVKVWGYGKKVYEEFLGLVTNPEYGDITDLEDGTDLTLSHSKNSGPWPVTKVTPSRRTSRVCQDMDPTECKEFLAQMPDIENIFSREDYNALKGFLNEALYAEGGRSPEAASSETEKFSPPPQKAEALDIDSVFDDLK